MLEYYSPLINLYRENLIKIYMKCNPNIYIHKMKKYGLA